MGRQEQTWIRDLVCLGLGIGLSASLAPAQGKSLAEFYKSGKIRFAPVITITDESMGGKEFFSLPNDLAVDGKGRILVSDGQANNIKVFDAAGKFIKTIGKAGQGPGDFNYPTDLEIVGGKLYIRELMNARISVFDAEDRYVSSVPTPREGGSWRSLRALPDGRFIVEKERADRSKPNSPQIAVLDLYAKDLEFIRTIYTHDVWRNKFITEPQRTNLPLPFAARVCWDIFPDGRIAIGYSGQYGIEFYDPDKGKLSGFSHAYQPVEITAKDKAEFFDSITFGYGSTSGGMVTGSRGAPDFMRNQTEFPKAKPAFQEIRTDRDGNIWVQPTGAAGDGPTRFDAFDKKGAFLGAVEIAEGGGFPRLVSWVKDGFWTLRSSENGEYALIKLRIEAAK